MPAAPEYKLVYHATIPGRGEFIRLLFEATGTPYVDTALIEGQEAIKPYSDGTFEGNDKNPLPFAPPVLVHGSVVLSQTPAILLYLASHLTASIDLGSDGKGESSKRSDADLWHAHAFALTALDLTNEIHDVHHPISVMEYYEKQKDVAIRKAPFFNHDKVPKFLKHFEDNLERAKSGFLLRSGPSHADLVLFQVVDGLMFALPKLLTKLLPTYPQVVAHYERVKSAPRIKAYLESPRRQKYSMGMFRYYPELDDQGEEGEKEKAE